MKELKNVIKSVAKGRHNGIIIKQLKVVVQPSVGDITTERSLRATFASASVHCFSFVPQPFPQCRLCTTKGMHAIYTIRKLTISGRELENKETKPSGNTR